jgi:hypothetical protein
MPPRNAADFLELAENCAFLARKHISALNETVDGHSLTEGGVHEIEQPGFSGGVF